MSDVRNLGNLTSLRETWKEMESVETRLLRRMTIEESARIYLSLCHTMASFIEQTRDTFLPERKAHLTALQERLRRFGEWKRRQNGNPAEPV